MYLVKSHRKIHCFSFTTSTHHVSGSHTERDYCYVKKKVKQRREVAGGSVLLSIWIKTTAGGRKTVRGACKPGHVITSENPRYCTALTLFRCVAFPVLK